MAIRLEDKKAIVAEVNETAGGALSVVLADPTPPPISDDSPSADLRSTAFLQPAKVLFEELGLWNLLSEDAQPLEKLAVIDCAGHPPVPRTERVFEPTDLEETVFGWNLPNWSTRKLLAEAAQKDGRIDIRFGTGFKSILTRESEAMVMLDDGTRLRTRLAIAADGRNSPLRVAVGIQLRTTRYGQKALAFNVTHTEPHKDISTELYLSGGAFTLVPLPDLDGQHASSVVWMNDGDVASDLLAMDADTFSEAATTRSCGLLGNLSLASKRQFWPVITQTATHLTAERTALIAEAAHVLPPIGAQGLNTSLNDVHSLIQLAKDHPDDIGSRDWLAAYAKAREGDIQMRARVIDAYNRMCRSGAAPVQALRSFGLKAVHDMAPVRKGVMRAGLGR